MASPCELLIDTDDALLAKHLLNLAMAETQRIEQKYSRYLAHNVMFDINHSDGHKVQVDPETHRLLTFAQTCFELSDGLFDLTSGILRKAWAFNAQAVFPTPAQISELLKFIGWQYINVDATSITLPAGFELDFGGIGKEYAVDAAAKLCSQEAPEVSVLVNFGGDIQVTRPRSKAPYWHVGIEDPKNNYQSQAMVQIASGGLATSGDSRRFIINQGKRYGHILNPKTGYPVSNAPRSVTVATDYCVHAGLLATMALLQGKDAEEFLQAQVVKYWCFW
jgi:thiamine biosynthesis lipoprotein